MDGVVGVTQCSISSGQSYTYKFEIHKEQHGTFWYHAHSAVKRADGLYGGLVVHKPADSRAVQSDASLYGYENEKMLLIGDWYHLPADRVLAEYKDFRNFAYEVSRSMPPLLGRQPFHNLITACAGFVIDQWCWFLQL